VRDALRDALRDELRDELDSVRVAVGRAVTLSVRDDHHNR
jgi:hypothetical protein